MNLFELSTKERFRFPFKGQISVEDLWELRAKELNEVYKVLVSQLKENNGESLLNIETKEDNALKAKIEIVKYIFDVKTKEYEERKVASENRKKNQKILELINRKQEAELENLLIEELKNLLTE